MENSAVAMCKLYRVRDDVGKITPGKWVLNSIGKSGPGSTVAELIPMAQECLRDIIPMVKVASEGMRLDSVEDICQYVVDSLRRRASCTPLQLRAQLPR
jgi:hypothetical protein